MIEAIDYPTLRRLYPNAFYITSDFRRNAAEVLRLNNAQFFFTDERGRHYFGEPVYDDSETCDSGLSEYPHEYLGCAW